jgi:hypothetical protein
MDTEVKINNELISPTYVQIMFIYERKMKIAF